MRYCCRQVLHLITNDFLSINYVSVVVRYIEGFITRDGPPTDENQRFIRLMKYNYLETLKKKLPTSVLDKSWPPSPSALQEVCYTDVCLSVCLSVRLSVCTNASTASECLLPLCLWLIFPFDKKSQFHIIFLSDSLLQLLLHRLHDNGTGLDLSRSSVYF